MLARGQRKKRLDFGGNPVVDPNAGMFEGILPLQYWQRQRVRQQSECTQLADLKLHELKATMAEVWALRVLLF